MNASLVSLALLVAVAPQTEKPLRNIETPSTRLFVRTIPDGAKIILDGEPLGESDGLFLVPPGVRKITVELDGYYSEGRQVRIRDGWITRVELALRKQPSPKGKPENEEDPSGSGASKPAPDMNQDSDAASKAAGAYVADAALPDPVRPAMLTVLRQHPTDTRWSGRIGTAMFALAAKALPSGEIRQRASPALLELTHMLAVHELLKAKSILDRYTATGLTDATTLRQAVEEAAGKLEVVGKVRGLVHGAAVHADFAVAYVIAEESDLTAHLLQPAELDKVQVAYRLVMHRQARQLMERSNWSDALLLWQHLHQRQLVSQTLYFDAARCLHQLGKKEDALRVLQEAIDAFGAEGAPEFYEQAGDVALAIDTEPALALAEKAFQVASDKLAETISDGQPEPGQDDLLP